MTSNEQWTGADVADFRRRYSISKASLGRQLSRHPRTVQEWERNRHKPLTESVSRALSYLEIEEERRSDVFKACFLEFLDLNVERDDQGSISAAELYRRFDAWNLGEDKFFPNDFARYHRVVIGPFKFRDRFQGLRWIERADIAPIIPKQVAGIRFEQAEDGRVSLARGAPLSEYERGKLSGLHEMLREAAKELIETIGASNGYRTLQRPAERYLKTLQCSTSELRDGDVEVLYACGLSLQAARDTLSRETERGDAPPEDIRIAAPLQQLLGLHGPFLQSTNRGIELYDQTDRDRRTHIEDLELKQRQTSLNGLLAKATDLIAEDAHEAIEAATATMASGTQEDRANAVGRRAIRNLLAELARVASSRRTWRVAAGTVAAEVLLSSKMGIGLIAGGSAVLDAMVGSGGQVVTAAQTFIVQNAPLIKAIADAGGPSFSWVSPFVDWLKNRIG